MQETPPNLTTVYTPKRMLSSFPEVERREREAQKGGGGRKAKNKTTKTEALINNPLPHHSSCRPTRREARKGVEKKRPLAPSYTRDSGIM